MPHQTANSDAAMRPANLKRMGEVSREVAVVGRMALSGYKDGFVAGRAPNVPRSAGEGPLTGEVYCVTNGAGSEERSAPLSVSTVTFQWYTVCGRSSERSSCGITQAFEMSAGLAKSDSSSAVDTVMR